SKRSTMRFVRGETKIPLSKFPNSLRCDTLVCTNSVFTLMPSPRYISKNRHGAFIFRIKIPVHLLHLFAGRTVITKSLKTYHQPTALRLARRYAAKADELFFQLEMKSKYLLSKTIQKAR